MSKMSIKPFITKDHPIRLKDIDAEVYKVIRRLNHYGHTAYLVGGGVRDLYLGNIPKDFDIATSARPNQVRKIFRNSRLIGRRFRIVHIVFKNTTIEVSTFRKKPEVVASPQSTDDTNRALLIKSDNAYGSEDQDVWRRDFTINALYLDILSGEIVDYIGGIRDLRQRVVRSIGDPQIRFREDPVRILRAIKFASRYRFRIDAQALMAMQEVHADIGLCTRPRVLEELFRIMACGNSIEALRILFELGALAYMIPELAQYLEHIASTVEEDRFWAVIAELDRFNQGTRRLSDTVVLATLLLPICEQLMASPPRSYKTKDRGSIVDQFLRKTFVNYRLRKRDLDRMKQLIIVQARLQSESKTGINRLVKKNYFAEALVLFCITTGAEEMDDSKAGVWYQRYLEMNSDGNRIEELSHYEPAKKVNKKKTRRTKRTRKTKK